MKISVYLALLTVVLLGACSTDVELNATYKNTAVIFGLIDPDFNTDNVSNALDTQWIKINKTFLGVGDNTVFAGIRDSSEYKESDFVSKKVYEISDGEIIHEYDLISKEVSNKSLNGVFYAPLQTLYYFTSPSGINGSSQYKIVLNFTDGREVSAITNVLNDDEFSWLSPQPNSSIILANPAVGGGVNYVGTAIVRWNSAENASLYDITLRFHFTEILYEGDNLSGAIVSVTPKYLDFAIGKVTTPDNSAPGQQLSRTFNGEAFFSFLASSLEHSSRIRRVIGVYENDATRCFDMLLAMGNDELKTYIDVNSPSTGIVQEKPVYTNVSNGLGLLGSRTVKTLTGLRLVAPNPNGTPQTGNLLALTSGITADLNFCDPDPTSDFACPE